MKPKGEDREKSKCCKVTTTLHTAYTCLPSTCLIALDVQN